MKSKSHKTYHEGANDERTAILAKVRRMKKDIGPSGLVLGKPWLEYLRQWLLLRNERYKAKAGGL